MVSTMLVRDKIVHKLTRFYHSCPDVSTVLSTCECARHAKDIA